MSDREMRRGVSLLINGGITQLDTEALQNVQKVAEDELDSRNIPSDRVDYLQKYLEICDTFIGSHADYNSATEMLNKLNEEYKDRIPTSLIKSEVAGQNLAGDDGWAPSMVCW